MGEEKGELIFILELFYISKRKREVIVVSRWRIVCRIFVGLILGIG